ncbi:MAG: NAD(P)-dependent oxidoreductase [Chloroflexota bacterium]
MRVLVAGASGALGKPTVRELLAAGHQVVGLARDDAAAAVVRELGAEVARGDLLDSAAVLAAADGAEAIVNLSGALPVGSETKRSAWGRLEAVWRQGTQSLLDAASAVDVQVYLQASLGLLYGDRGDAWVTEETPLARESLMAAALDADRLVQKAGQDGLPTVTLRLGMIYGRDAWHTRILAQQARQKTLAVVGDGGAYWSLVHVDDAARAIARAVDDAAEGAVYNVSDDRPMKMLELLSLIAKLTGAPQPTKVPAMIARALVGGDIITLLTTSVRLSNRAIVQDLELELAFPTAEDGLKVVLGEPLPDPA